MSERLDRIERILENHATAIARHDEMIGLIDERLYTLAGVQAQNSAEITELKGIVRNAADRLDVMVEQAEIDRQEFRAEMREMRTEIRDILNRLSERFNGNGHAE